MQIRLYGGLDSVLSESFISVRLAIGHYMNNVRKTMIKQLDVVSSIDILGRRRIVVDGCFVAVMSVFICCLYILGVVGRFFSYRWPYKPIDISMTAVYPIMSQTVE